MSHMVTYSTNKILSNDDMIHTYVNRMTRMNWTTTMTGVTGMTRITAITGITVITVMARVIEMTRVTDNKNDWDKMTGTTGMTLSIT